MDYKERMAIERRVLTNLVETARKHGYIIIKGNDGEDWNRLDTLDEILEMVFSVDECRLGFRHTTGGAYQSVYIVLGNDGWDCIADNTCGTPEWDAVIAEVDAFCNEGEGT
jgi:hypothetical protein